MKSTVFLSVEYRWGKEYNFRVEAYNAWCWRVQCLEVVSTQFGE